jgi:hypothetical protein
VQRRLLVDSDRLWHSDANVIDNLELAERDVHAGR